jgi:hypothetical protein
LKKIPLLLFISISTLFAELSEPIHSSILTYFESKDYSNSKQKDDALTYGIGADIHYMKSAYKVIYETSRANTKQPPMQHDLKVQKIFLRYGYSINDSFEININYLNILHDNIALTDDGKIYGLGCTYNFNKKLSLNLTQFYSDYDDFNVYQSDFRVDYKLKIGDVKLKLSSISKYINIDETKRTRFTTNAKNSYFTSGFKLHSHYNSYHLGTGIYFGKRAFAIMKDGFKVQHHAMEFDRTYAIGVGKTIDKFVFRFQYVYQRATEMPTNTKDVDIKVMRFIGNYKF